MNNNKHKYTVDSTAKKKNISKSFIRWISLSDKRYSQPVKKALGVFVWLGSGCGCENKYYVVTYSTGT